MTFLKKQRRRKKDYIRAGRKLLPLHIPKETHSWSGKIHYVVKTFWEKFIIVCLCAAMKSDYQSFFWMVLSSLASVKSLSIWHKLVWITFTSVWLFLWMSFIINTVNWEAVVEWKTETTHPRSEKDVTTVPDTSVSPQMPSQSYKIEEAESFWWCF